MNDRAPPQVLVVGQFPPPVNGFSYVTEEMAKLLSSVHKVEIVDLRPHAHEKGAGYHFERLRLAFSGVVAILRHAAKARGAPVYLACEGSYGLVYMVLLALAARSVGASVYLHHHSFYYIDRTFAPMSLLLGILGRNVTHVFLSLGMAQRFVNRYPCRVNAIVLSNSAFVELLDKTKLCEKPSSEPLTIGLLSNLNEEKGLGGFIRTLCLARKKGLNVKGILAGPAAEQDLQTIENAKRELGNLLEYHGPVYGENKRIFYEQMDVFIFPTMYPNEAQPTVIFEAMAHGVPVLSYNRGCIMEQVGEAGFVAEQGADFPIFACEHMARWLSNPQSFSSLRLATLERFSGDHAEAVVIATNLLSLTPRIMEPL